MNKKYTREFTKRMDEDMYPHLVPVRDSAAHAIHMRCQCLPTFHGEPPCFWQHHPFDRRPDWELTDPKFRIF